jgi:hypothetical protein
VTRRIAIVGSRSWRDLDAVRRLVRSLPSDCIVVSGGARGVDSVAEETADARGLAKKIITPHDAGDLRVLSFAAACHIRNRMIATACDELHAFLAACDNPRCRFPDDETYRPCPYDGWSHGTAATIGYAKNAGKSVVIHREEESHG